MHPAHPRPHVGLAALCLLIAGCTEVIGKPVRFVITVHPILPPSQADLFDDIDTLLVRTIEAGETLEEFTIEVARGTSPAIDGLSILPEGVAIELEGYAGSDLIARGISGPLTVGRREQVDVDIYVSALGETATFDDLPAPSAGAAVVSDGAGTFYVFGGTDQDIEGDSVDAIQRWSLIPPNEGFDPVTVAGFPIVDTEWVSGLVGRAQATATLLAEGDHADLGKILVTGGWEGYGASDTVTKQAFLFDPSAEPDLAIELLDDLNLEHADHEAVALGSGDVVIFGGYAWVDGVNQISGALRVEVYHPSERSFTKGDTLLDRPYIDGAAARLGDDAFYCGGIRWSSSTYGAFDDCLRVDRNAQTSVVSGPSQLRGAGLLLPSMARLGSSAVLLTGGAEIDGLVSDSTSVPASDAAYIYDGVSAAWQQATPMHVARAGHVSAALPDGRVLVAGGAATIRTAGLLGEDLLACAEIYDPDDDTWTELDPGCSSTDSVGSLPQGLFVPSVGVDPYYGVLVWGGHADEGTAFAAQPTYALFTPFPG
jgi:hypothetical protein